MSQNQRNVNLFGVQVTTNLRTKSFGLSVVILPTADLFQVRKNNLCEVIFKSTGGLTGTQKAVRFQLDKIPYDTKHLSKQLWYHFKMPNGGTCTISLAPAFYLSHELREEYWKQREVSKKKSKKHDKKSASTGPSICSRIGGSGKKRGKSPTVYSYNNAGKPYQGGRCSPK